MSVLHRQTLTTTVRKYGGRWHSPGRNIRRLKHGVTLQITNKFSGFRGNNIDLIH